MPPKSHIAVRSFIIQTPLCFELRNFKGPDYSSKVLVHVIYQECAHDWKCCSVGEIEMGRGAVNLHKTKKVIER